MKTIYSFGLSLLLFFGSFLQAQETEKTQAINWLNFSTNFNIIAASHCFSKPLQYNNELDLISFVQRISPYYPSTPPPSTFAASGVVVGYLSGNWGATWDSTCIWSNDSYAARYPQGGVYNPPGNFNLSNAYLLGTGPYLDQTLAWAGNWSASKQLGLLNYNTSASVLPSAQQLHPITQPLPPFGRCHDSYVSFSCTDDGKMRFLAKLGGYNDPEGYRGAMVLKANFNNGVFTWTGDSIEPPTYHNSPYHKVLHPKPLMAWNESGTVGYIVFLGSRDNAKASNFGIQPIVYKTTNSGNTWQITAPMDFNSSSADNLKKFLPPVNAFDNFPNLIVPNVQADEGWDVVVDKNNSLHIACLLNGATSTNFDSIFNRRNNGIEGYHWQHVPGRRPYLVDFIQTQNEIWSYGIIDSLSSEAPGSMQFSPGYANNPWGMPDVTNASRIQCSRTPDGRFVVITYAESDTITATGFKWNSSPDIKARLIDTDTYGLSPTEINLSAGTNPNVAGAATMHYTAPRCATATLSANTFDLKLPVTISNNPGFLALVTSSNWFSAAELSFSNLTSPFAQTITAHYVGINETRLQENYFELYPNPVSSSLKIRRSNSVSGSYSIDLFDVSGRKLYTENTNATEFELNVAGLEAGTYFIRISNKEMVSYKKMIKE